MIAFGSLGQTNNDMLEGKWYLTGISHNYGNNSYSRYSPDVIVDVADDSLHSLTFDDASLTISAEDGYQSFDQPHFYTTRTDSSVTIMPTSKERYVSYSNNLVLTSHRQSKKQRKGKEPLTEMVYEIVKLTNSQLVLKYYESNWENPFDVWHARFDIYTKHIEDTNAVVEADFAGKWYLRDHVEDHYSDPPKNMTLSKDSCVVIRKKADILGEHSTYTQTFTFSISQTGLDNLSFNFKCLDCSLPYGIYYTSEWWTLSPEKSEISLNGTVYRYLFEGRTLRLSRE